MKSTWAALTALLLPGLCGCGTTEKVSGVWHGMTHTVGTVGKKITPDFGGKGEDKTADSPFLDGERVYFVIEENSQRRERGFVVRNRSTWNGKPCLVQERERQRSLERGGVKYETRIVQSSITSLTGEAFKASTVTLAGGEREVDQVIVKNGKASFEKYSTAGGSRNTATLDVPEGIMFGIDPEWLVRQGIEVGKTYKATVLDRATRALVEETCTVRSRGTEQVLGREMEVWVTESSRGGGTPVTMVFNDSGDLVRLQADTIAYRLVGKQEYDTNLPPLRIVSSVPLAFDLPSWDTFSELVFEVSPAADWREFLKDKDYIDVRDTGDRIFVTLKSRAPRNVFKSTLPMRVPPEIAPYLASAGNIMPNNSEIAGCARRAVGGNHSAIDAMALLAGFVHQHIRWSNGDTLNPNPLETLKSGKGDCSEHADLFASLARSVGIPTRHCQGLIFQRDKAVYHAWAEAWIDGQWVAVDTTVNRVGLPAGYLLTARGTGDGAPKDEFAWRLRKGGLTINLVSATRDYPGRNLRHTLTPGNKKTYVARQGNWLANVYWGFAVELPRGWKGDADLNYVNLSSPDPTAPLRVKIEAIDGELEATESALRRIEASLAKQYDDFKLCGSSVMDLPIGPVIKGKERVTTSRTLYTDFTCRSGESRLHCRQYLIPRAGRAYRIWILASESAFPAAEPYIQKILDTLEL